MQPSVIRAALTAQGRPRLLLQGETSAQPIAEARNGYRTSSVEFVEAVAARAFEFIPQEHSVL